MPFFASYDPAAPQPTRVIGWYSTCELDYGTQAPPALRDLLVQNGEEIVVVGTDPETGNTKTEARPLYRTMTHEEVTAYTSEHHPGFVHLTPDEWAAHLKSDVWFGVQDGKLVPMPPHDLTIDDLPPVARMNFLLAQGLCLAGGVTGTFSADAATHAKVASMLARARALGRMPGSAGVLPWPDVDGCMVVFSSVDQFQAFSDALNDFVADVHLVGSGNLTHENLRRTYTV